MAKSRRSRPSRLSATNRAAYWEVTKRPLQILAFLLPLVIAYEISLVFLLRSEHGVHTNIAHSTLLHFFAAFGVAPRSGFYLGGVVVVLVLLLWHVLNRDPWKVDYPALGFMALESLALTMPLLVLGQLITKAAIGHGPAPAIGGVDSTTSLASLDMLSKMAISVGAGLYEELMFRMLLIAVIHTMLVDLGKASHKLGATIAVAVSAAAFAWYHPLNAPIDAVFYFIAGLYFGTAYVLRGFGIVVATHAFYDVIAFLLGS